MKKYAVAISFSKNGAIKTLSIHKVKFKEKTNATEKENQERAVDICFKRDSSLSSIKAGETVSNWVTIKI